MGLSRWGGEKAATGAVDLHGVQFLDAVFDLAALAVNLFVEPLRSLLHIGDDEAWVILWRLIFGAHYFGFDDDAAFPLPCSGRITGFAVILARVDGIDSRAKIELRNHLKIEPTFSNVALALPWVERNLHASKYTAISGRGCAPSDSQVPKAGHFDRFSVGATGC